MVLGARTSIACPEVKMSPYQLGPSSYSTELKKVAVAKISFICFGPAVRLSALTVTLTSAASYTKKKFLSARLFSFYAVNRLNNEN